MSKGIIMELRFKYLQFLHKEIMGKIRNMPTHQSVSLTLAVSRRYQILSCREPTVYLTSHIMQMYKNYLSQNLCLKLDFVSTICIRRLGLSNPLLQSLALVLKMLSAYHVCCIYSNAHQKVLTMKENTICPYQTAPNGTV